ncbi:Fur family transcriptional regulator [Bacteroidota bacterium]
MNEKARKVFTTYLKEGKFRITPERFEVMDYALDFQGHFGADDLFIKMKSDNSNVSRATVYNTLDLLFDCDLLSRRNFGDKLKRYESNFQRKNHDHVICEQCGKIIEFSNPKVQKIVKEVSDELGIEVINYSFNIYGKCKSNDECQENKKHAHKTK